MKKPKCKMDGSPSNEQIDWLDRRIAALEARSEAEGKAATSAPAAPEKPVTGRTFDDAVAWLRERVTRMVVYGQGSHNPLTRALLACAEDLEQGRAP